MLLLLLLLPLLLLLRMCDNCMGGWEDAEVSPVAEAIDNPGVLGYVFAKRIGMSEHRLNRLRKGRVKSITEDDVARISRGIKRDPDHVRQELERRAREHREDVARAA